MKELERKIIVYALAGMMQFGVCASVLAASPQEMNALPMQQKYDRDQGSREDEHMERDRHERERMERERHERVMKRRPHEDEREWHERQRRENERHEENMRRIAHDILDLILDDD